MWAMTLFITESAITLAIAIASVFTSQPLVMPTFVIQLSSFSPIPTFLTIAK